MYSIKDVTTKALLLTFILFLSGCSTFELVTVATEAIEIVATEKSVIDKTQIKKLKPPTKNWNKPEPVLLITTPKATPTTIPEEEPYFPWWLLFIAIISGTTYFINSRKR